MIYIKKFSDDQLWKEAKRYAQYESQPDNWILIIDFYTSYEGKNVQMFCTTESLGTVRLIGLTDCSLPILMDKAGKVYINLDYNEVYESRKSFYFQPSPKKSEIDLPSLNGNQYTYLGETSLTIYE